MNGGTFCAYLDYGNGVSEDFIYIMCLTFNPFLIVGWELKWNGKSGLGLDFIEFLVGLTHS